MIFNPVFNSGGDNKQWLEVPIEDIYIYFDYHAFRVEHNFIILIQDEDPRKSFCTFVDIDQQEVSIPDQTYYWLGVDFHIGIITVEVMDEANPTAAYFLPDVGISL